jgi:glycosyltransferase involved in cell wall biosynthesis
MKIFIIDPLGSEGQAMYDWALCENLKRNGEDVTFISCPEFEYDDVPRSFSAQLILSGYRNRSLSAIRKIFGYLTANIRMLRFILREKPTVVHYQFLLFPLVDFFFLTLLRRRTRLVFTAHDVKVTTGSVIKGLLLKKCVKLFHGIQVHSLVTRKLLFDYLGQYSQPVITIPHGNYQPLFDRHVEKKSSKNNVRQKYGVPTRAKVVLFLGSILDYKGLDILIESFAMAKEKDPLLHLVIAGSTRGRTFEKYDAMITQMGVGNVTTKVVKYLSEEEVIEMITLADIIALPYRECYTPGVAHLSMSFGLPVIAADTGAFASVIKDGETGFLVVGNNVEQWGARIPSVFVQRDLLIEVGRNGRELMLREHSWDSIAKSIIKFYKELVAS